MERARRHFIFPICVQPGSAAPVADTLRRTLIAQREIFVFETVFSDSAGDKQAFLKEACEAGYSTILCFIGISDPNVSEQLVVMRSPKADTTFRFGRRGQRYIR